MDLPQLQALAAVVDEGSFDAAAAALHLTPSAVSQRIKALEASAGQVLVRRARPTAATEAGEAYVRLARQVDALVQETQAQLGADAVATVPIAVNADSMATWLLPALATLPPTITFDLRRDDQAHTADLLRSGAVMGAITSDDQPVQGCRSERLGAMRYRPMATPEVAARWFGGGVDAASLAIAPMIVFDRRDDLQDLYLRRRSRSRLSPPRHHVPASTEFAQAVLLGLGWGMLPDEQSLGPEREGRLVELDPGQHVDVTLHWQQWTLRTPALDTVAAVIREAAGRHLR